MKFIIKILILITRDITLFSLKGFRDIRNALYRKYYNAPHIFVSEKVIMQPAHINKENYFVCKNKVNIGRGTYIDYSGGILFGNMITISENVCIFTHNHIIHDGYKDWHKNSIVFSKLEIQNYVWICACVIILPSVTFIAEGSVIAAGAILSKNTEPYGIYAGNPAIKIGTRRINEK